ncbi:MAG TPA: glycosyltransferase [Chthoniobacteraceae bacterium]|nr:glycosyltransferase [Chthoniobacteraceae bacterium]
MPRVLIPSDNREIIGHLAAAYRRRGWDAVVGVNNFAWDFATYDLVHLQWPEELSGWEPPSQARIAEISARLDYWNQQARLLLTVHNVRPHLHGDHSAYTALFEAVYARVPVLAHFTDTSRRLVESAFPQSAAQSNVVTGFFNLDALLPTTRDPAAARRALGIPKDEFVVLIFGALRNWAEVQLLREGFAGARIPRKRLLMAGRYQEFGPVWRQRWRRFAWQRWLRTTGSVVAAGFTPDQEIHRLVDAADALVAPRINVLNSGLTALAMSFGKILIAPDCGAFPELLDGTQNPIYPAGDAEGLARAIERAASLDGAEVARENRALADGWSWDALVERGLEAVDLA